MVIAIPVFAAFMILLGIGSWVGLRIATASTFENPENRMEE